MWFVYAMLANVLWSLTDVLMSCIVHRVHKDPIVLGFFLGCANLGFLTLLYLYRVPEVTHIGLLILGAVFAYLGMISFFTSLLHVDVSVSSVTWVFMSIGIAAGGMFLFGETWSGLQSLGAMLSICGIFMLSFWHKHVSLLRTCCILALPGLLFVPHFLINEYVLLSGVSSYTVFFWNICFYGVFTISVPVVIPRYRRIVTGFFTKARLPFYGLIVLRAVFTMMATYMVVKAYDTGYASLVGIAENGQPFFLMLFAWIATRIAPKYAPKELLTAQSVGIKIASFCIVFTGMGLLALG